MMILNMKPLRGSIVALAALSLCVLPELANAALNAYLTLQGEAQGQIDGPVTQAGREGTLEIFSFEYEVEQLIDAATGLPTGRRQHKPIKVTTAVDRSSPQLFQALVSNEILTEFELRFYRQTRNGVERNFYSVRLTNARIIKIRVVQPDTLNPENARKPLLEEVWFVFESIEVTYEPGPTAQDDWESPGE